jgi:hypothetical protein
MDVLHAAPVAAQAPQSSYSQVPLQGSIEPLQGRSNWQGAAMHFE